MEFKIKDDRVAVKIDLKNLLDEIKGTVDTPCGINVLCFTEDVKKLTVENREKFH